MIVIAVAFIAAPSRRFKGQVKSVVVPLAVFIVAVSLGLYQKIGMPGAPSAATTASAAASGAEVPGVDEMVEALAARLGENPEDLAGWKMLGRSYVELREYPKAIAAYEKAVELESSQNAETLVELGEVLLMSDQSALGGRAARIFESAIAISPNYPKGLFYAGMAAAERGDTDLAADRWEALLATSPPANIEQIIRTRVAEWRGGTPAVMPEQPGTVVSANVSVAASAAGSISPTATVFLIARDPSQPRPPIAAVRRQAGELPATIAIGDSDAMIPGRVPSGFTELEIIARISTSGQPIAQPGDWFGQAIVSPGGSAEIDIVIDRQVQ